MISTGFRPSQRAERSTEQPNSRLFFESQIFLSRGDSLPRASLLLHMDESLMGMIHQGTLSPFLSGCLSLVLILSPSFSSFLEQSPHPSHVDFFLFLLPRRIRAGTELTWDYNYEVGSVEGKELLCCCGAIDCRGRLL